MTTIIEIKNISRAFPGVQALNEVSLKIDAGNIHALVGENGAGKSTLIKILSGALTADSGQIMLNGDKYIPRNPREAIQNGVATIYQDLNLLSLRSVVENVSLGKEPTQFGWLDKTQARKEVGKVLEQLNAAQIPLDSPVGNLKVGEKQIIEIAKALIRDCNVLIMDEPTAALNDTETDLLFKTIKKLRDQGVTIIYVSHRLGEIFQITDCVSVMRDGRHIATYKTKDVTPDKLINDMIGRKLEGVFPPRNKKIGNEIIKVENLTSHGVFQDISFCLHEGEVVAVTGLTGSGKTELGKALFGDQPIDAGSIRFMGRIFIPNPTKAVEMKFGYLPEDRKKEGLLEEVSVLRNLSLAILPRISNWLGFLDRDKETQNAQEQVNGLGIKTPSLKQIVRNLSGGNQQKVSLGKWLATGSRALILMEPTLGIDVAVKFEIYRLIHDLSNQGVAILLISSEMAEILGLAHRIIVLHNGRLSATLVGNKTNSEEILKYAFGQKKEKKNG